MKLRINVQGCLPCPKTPALLCLNYPVKQFNFCHFDLLLFPSKERDPGFDGRQAPRAKFLSSKKRKAKKMLQRTEANKAETARFELAIELPLYTLSRRAPSTTRTRLHF